MEWVVCDSLGTERQPTSGVVFKVCDACSHTSLTNRQNSGGVKQF